MGIFLCGRAVVWEMGFNCDTVDLLSLPLLVGIGGLGCYVLWKIWRGFRNAHRLFRAVLKTIAICVFMIMIFIALDRYINRGSIGFFYGWQFCGAGAILAVWVSAFHRLRQRNIVLDRDNQVCVHCPSCGYSLIGLTELRCPECGATFTIDELIRAQRYAAAEQSARRP